MRPALLIIDMQRFFMAEAPEVFREKLLPNIERLLSLFRSSGVPVVHVITRYSTDRSDWPLPCREKGSVWCLSGTEGAEVLPEAAPLPGEPVVVKTRFSGFYRTKLEDVLNGLGADTLFMAGYSCDVCVRMTTLDAFNRDFRLRLVADCTHAAFEETSKSIEYLRRLTGLTVVPLDELELTR